MSTSYSDQCHVLFPRFVFHRQYRGLEEFNKTLFELASKDAAAHRTDGTQENAIGSRPTHLAHLRHNFLAECKHPVIAQLIKMVDEALREYLRTIYNYDHKGEITLMSDTFHQQKSTGENVGVNCHCHWPAHFAVVYYVRVDRDPEEGNPLRQGSVRFYDPQNLSTRQWPNNNPSVFTGAWFNLVPEEGSLVIFEGHLPHDSTYFDGEHRLCVPVMANIVTPRSHRPVAVSDLLDFQEK